MSSTGFQAAVFDMDGLLLNTEDLYDVVIDDLLRNFGAEFTPECKLAIMGKPAPVALEILRETHQLPMTWKELGSEIESRLFAILPTRLAVLPGVARLLSDLESMAIPKSVATSSSRVFAEEALGQVGLLERFDFLICGEEVKRGKPEPDIYLESFRRRNIDSAAAIVFEDSHTGSLAASRAQAFTVACPGPHSTGQDFSHADLVVARVDDDDVYRVLRQSV